MVEAVKSESDSKSLNQFIKFCIIGFSSAIIDFGVLNLLVSRLGVPLASSISFALAVTNGYIWNSVWTFRGMGSSSRHKQYLKFVAVNIVGYILTMAIMSGMIFALTGRVMAISPHSHSDISKFHLNIAKAAATVIVAIWNFTANKKWTFS